MTTHIALRDYSLAFPVFKGSARSLKKTIVRQARSSLAPVREASVGGVLHGAAGGGDTVMVQAIDRLSLDIGAGERVGLVGHNGAGKSTMLRALAGIYESADGLLQVQGHVHALLDPQSGMNPELSGRENVRLFACRLQYDRARTTALERDVEAFAELGAFFDLPVRLYSSGMTVRIGFALATAPRPEILLMDEWFLAGDQHFQDKARARLEDLIDSADILVLTSHSLPILRRWCTRVIWMEAGRIRLDGPPGDVLDAYEASQNIRAVDFSP